MTVEPEIVGTILALIGGKELLSYLVKSVRQQQVTDAKADHDREANVIKALVDMAERQSNAQINLTQEAIGTLKTMVGNVARQAIALESSTVDSENWSRYFRQEIEIVQRKLDVLQVTSNENSERIKALVHALASD